MEKVKSRINLHRFPVIASKIYTALYNMYVTPIIYNVFNIQTNY